MGGGTFSEGGARRGWAAKKVQSASPKRVGPQTIPERGGTWNHHSAPNANEKDKAATGVAPRGGKKNIA